MHEPTLLRIVWITHSLLIASYRTKNSLNVSTKNIMSWKSGQKQNPSSWAHGLELHQCP